MRRSIELKLHHEEGTFLHLLESQDIYDFVDESSVEDVELAYYVEKWCEWLNYFFLNDATVNGNLEEARLRGWINGYNYAKHVDEQEYDDRYILVMKKYVITIHKPKKDVIFHYEKIY